MAKTYLIIGGICGNWEAFEALLLIAKQAQIPPENFIITGDLIAYCADGAQVGDYCRQHLTNAIIVRGNCERTVSEDSEDCGCGFLETSVCALVADKWFTHAKNTVSAATKAWMKNLPSRTTVQIGGKRLAVFHATSNSDNTFIFASTTNKEKEASLDSLQCDGAIVGHSGLPFTSKLTDNRLWHNSGALGMPANDGTPRTWYSLWHVADDDSTITISHTALNYNASKTVLRMQEFALPKEYQQTLQTGLWADLSILPPSERQQQGVFIKEQSFIWT